MDSIVLPIYCHRWKKKSREQAISFAFLALHWDFSVARKSGCSTSELGGYSS